MSVLEIIVSIVTIIGALGGIFGGILGAFYKSNKQAKFDYMEIEKRFDRKLDKIESEFKSKLKDDSSDLKEEIEKLSNKIDEMGTKFVTTTTFNTFSESLNQLLKMYNDKTARLEGLLDNLSDDINNFIRKYNKN